MERYITGTSTFAVVGEKVIDTVLDTKDKDAIPFIHYF